MPSTGFTSSLHESTVMQPTRATTLSSADWSASSEQRNARASGPGANSKLHACAEWGVQRGLVQPRALLEHFRRIEPRLYRYPAIDPQSFRRSVEDFARSAGETGSLA